MVTMRHKGISLIREENKGAGQDVTDGKTFGVGRYCSWFENGWRSSYARVCELPHVQAC